MTDPRLVDYARGMLSAGWPADYLTQILLGQGWRLSEIQEAMRIARGEAPGQDYPPAPPAPDQIQPLQPPALQESPRYGWRPGIQESESYPSGAQETAPRYAAGAPRPFGITAISILGLLGSALMLIAGITMLTMGGLIGGFLMPGGPMFDLAGMGAGSGAEGGGVITFLFGLMGAWLDAVGLAEIALSVIAIWGFYQLLKMRRKGWVTVTAIILTGFACTALLIVLFMPSLIGLASSEVFSSVLVMTLLPLVIPAAVLGMLLAYMFKKRKLFA